MSYKKLIVAVLMAVDFVCISLLNGYLIANRPHEIDDVKNFTVHYSYRSSSVYITPNENFIAQFLLLMPFVLLVVGVIIHIYEKERGQY